MLRTIGGVIVGVIAAFLAAMLVARIGGIFYPLRVDPEVRGTVEQLQASFAGAPLGAQLFIIISWFAGGLVGALAAKAITRSSRAGWTAAGIMALVALLNMFVLPMPAWMQISAVALPLLGGLIGNHLVPEGARGTGGRPAADA